mgnify:CR=1 FL=1
MPQAPDQLQPRIGYQDQPHPFKQALDHVVNTIMAAQGSGNKQPWGFHEPTVTAGQAVGPAAQATSDALADPRNAWMGLGPLGALGTMARFRRVPDLGREMGGFNVPANQMRKDMGIPRPNRRLNEVPGGDESEVRSEYLNGMQGMNALADLMKNGEGGTLLSMLTPAGKDMTNNVLRGQMDLIQEALQQRHGYTGGSAPTSLQLRRFGFKPQQ